MPIALSPILHNHQFIGDRHWTDIEGEQWTWQRSKDNGGPSFVHIGAKWLA